MLERFVIPKLGNHLLPGVKKGHRRVSSSHYGSLRALWNGGARRASRRTTKGWFRMHQGEVSLSLACTNMKIARPGDGFDLDVWPMRKKQQVVIVGGGPVGMAMAIELAQRGITSAIVERRTQEHRIPKGQGLQQRTMEHFYSWGLLEKLRAARVLPVGFSLSGDGVHEPEHRILGPTAFSRGGRPVLFPEERAGPTISDRTRAARSDGGTSGLESWMGWTVDFIEQDQGCVRVGMVAQDSKRQVLEADYAIGCDGSHSIVREQIGIERGGENFDQLMVLTVIRSPELEAGLKRFPPRATYRAMDPELKGHWRFFGRVDAQETFFFHAPVPPNTTKDNYDFQRLMEKATGFKFKCEFDYVGFWELRIAVADRYRVGRVFIAGDAAHSHPPMEATASTMASTMSPILAEARRAPAWLGQRGFAGYLHGAPADLLGNGQGLHPRAH